MVIFGEELPDGAIEVIKSEVGQAVTEVLDRDSDTPYAAARDAAMARFEDRMYLYAQIEEAMR